MEVVIRNIPKQIFFSHPEMRQIEAAIQRSGAGTFSGWARQILLTEARRESGE